VRNLGRRPGRTALTALACALVAGVLAGTAGFARGLRASFALQGSDEVAILLSTVAQRDVLRSTVPLATVDLVAADVAGIAKVHGVPAVSAEIHMGTNLRLGEGPGASGSDPVHAAFVRGVTERAFLVHDNVTLVEGSGPAAGEVIVGRLVAAKLKVDETELQVGRHVRFEGATWRIAGRFAAPGTTVESEIWAPLHELKGLSRRDDCSAVFVRVAEPDALDDLEVFAKRRLDLELTCIPSRAYYGELAAYFAPIQGLAWGMAVLIALTVVFTGANTLNTSVQDRIQELATLRALGYRSGALVRSLLVEASLLAAGGGLVGLVAARWLVAGSTFRIAMTAFTLEVRSEAVLAGMAGVLLLGLIGTLPASLRVARLPVAVALKED
jgi:ABC-type lipoprotein release transport system permease subunit